MDNENPIPPGCPADLVYKGPGIFFYFRDAEQQELSERKLPQVQMNTFVHLVTKFVELNFGLGSIILLNIEAVDKTTLDRVEKMVRYAPFLRFICILPTAGKEIELQLRRVGVKGLYTLNNTAKDLSSVIAEVQVKGESFPRSYLETVGNQPTPRKYPDDILFRNVAKSALTEDLLDVLRGIGEEMTDLEIAEHLSMDVNKVRAKKAFLQNILNAKNKIALAKAAVAFGLVGLE